MAKKATKAGTPPAPTYVPAARDPFHIKLNAEERGMLDKLARGENRTRADMVRQLIRRAAA